MSSRFYITTAIDYPNGSPHMGHAYEKILTDTYARWERMKGSEVIFLTGTDENGQKLVKAAAEAKMETRAYVDKNVETFRKLCRDLEISNDDFIRTTDDRHITATQSIWKRIEANGDIYFDQYSGQYCLACEAFYTETQAPDAKCPSHGTALEIVKEDGYFFRLSKYASWIRDTIASQPSFLVPESSRNEMLRRIDAEPVKDLSVSRPNQGWGIPIPSNSKFVIYTWFDALINYIAPFLDKPTQEKWWPADVHVIGKDITWFHSVIWPCMLKSAGLPIPRQIFVHGMVLGQDGRKMSKSLGNGVDPYEILGKYPLESFRYYLLRAIPSGGDGAFVTADLVARHNSELANDFGNLLMRVAKFWIKKNGPDLDTVGVNPAFDFNTLGQTMDGLMKKREHHRALEALWAEIVRVNTYFSDSTPWKLEGTDPKFKEIMANSIYALHCFGTLIGPFMPKTSQAVLQSLGTKDEGLKGLNFAGKVFKLSEPPSLFPKFDTK